MSGLSVSSLVRVSVQLTPTGAQGLTFGVLMIAGDSNVINGIQRVRSYQDILSVANDFGTTAPEYLAAALYFGQSPQPNELLIGRWFSSASAAINDGGILSASQQVLSNWTNISNGSFVVNVDGTPYTLTGLNFTAATNLNGVASIITAALATAGSTGTCVFNGTNFEIISGTVGVGTRASGTITFTGPGANLDTVTIDGTVVTLVTGAPSGNQVQIGVSAAATAANLQTFLQNSVDVNISKATYSTVLDVVTATFKLVGIAGNSFSLAKSSTAITLSGADLAGGTVPSSVGFATTAGSGTDISAQLMFTSSTSQALIPGFAAETPVQCATILANVSPIWYGLMFAATAVVTDSQSLAVSDFIEAQGLSRLYGVTTSESGALSNLVSNDLGSLMAAAGYNQSMIQYSSTNPYAIASLFGRAFSVNFEGNNTTIVLMYKQEPGVVAESITPGIAQTLKAKNINVFVSYVNNTTIMQYGVVSSGQFIDTIQGIGWLQNAIQTAVYNVLFTTTTKIPQTDSGVNQITNAIAGVCGQAVANGFVAGGTWNAPGFGSLTQGQYLKSGYYIFATPIAQQSEADRQTRAAPPIQTAVKLAGGIQTVFDLVSVNQ